MRIDIYIILYVTVFNQAILLENLEYFSKNYIKYAIFYAILRHINTKFKSQGGIFVKLSKISVITSLLIGVCSLVFAEVRVLPLEEKGSAGSFCVSLPKPVLRTSLARQTASAAIDGIIDKFRYQAQKIGNTKVRHYVTADNDLYVSLLFEGVASLADTGYEEKEAHAIVIDKASGEPMKLEAFMRMPDLQYLLGKIAKKQVMVFSCDGQNELELDALQELSVLPKEFILDKDGNVFLLATDITVNSIGTPLLALPKNNFKDIYIAKR